MRPITKRRITAIVGTVGIPAQYGGFETLAENLVRYHHDVCLEGQIVVYCSSRGNSARIPHHLGAVLRYMPLNANGPMSVLYDAVSLMAAAWSGADVILLLGVSGAFALPILRVFSRAKIVTNVDGLEWKRAKWTGFARWWLKQSERWAVSFSHVVIADNAAIAEHIERTYCREPIVIAYGGDHAVEVEARPLIGVKLPERYALALCRIEPENNVEMILNAFEQLGDMPLVFVGNWSNSTFGQEMRRRYGNIAHLQLLDPIYEPAILRTIRGNAALYVHGHSAGGTNPSLVEMMHFGITVLAFDCVYNRFTTGGEALFFRGTDELKKTIETLTREQCEAVGAAMLRLARERYTWQAIGREYFRLLSQCH